MNSTNDYFHNFPPILNKPSSQTIGEWFDEQLEQIPIRRQAEKMQRIKDREEYMHVIPPDRATRPMSELEENYYRQIAAFRKTSKQERAELFKGWNSRPPLPNV